MPIREIVRPSGIRIRYSEEAFVLAEQPAPATKSRRSPAGYPTHPIKMPVASGDSLEVRGVLDALENSELYLIEPFDWQPQIEATMPSGKRRAGAPTIPPQDLSIEIDLAEDEQSVMLLEQDGFYSWALPSAVQSVPQDSDVRRGKAGNSKTAQFAIVIQPEALHGVETRRGFVREFIYGRVRAWAFRFVAKAGIQLGVKLLERHIKEGPVIINSETDPSKWLRPIDLSKIKLPKERPARILLMIHGTFSSTAGGFSALCVTPWGQEFLKSALEYYDLILGYDHRTLSEDPYSNAVELFECLTTLAIKYPARMDAICHSRGGLVLRSLVESILPKAGAWQADVGNCVFVAATNGGTLLAEPDNWQTLLDLYTNLAAATSRVLALFPQTAAAGLILKETVSTLSALVKALASGAITANGIPGLAAMEPDGKFVTEINKTQSGQKGPIESQYYVIESNFEAKLLPDGTHEPKEFPKRLVFLLADKLLDQLMREANDLVVNTRSMSAIDMEAGNFVKDKLDFGKNSAVYHTNYFTRNEVTSALARWLSLPAPGQSHYAAPGTLSGPALPAAVDSNIAVIESSATADEAAATIQKKLPSYVVVRRPQIGKTLHYAYRSEEILDTISAAPPDATLKMALNLHEYQASSETSAGNSLSLSSARIPNQRLVLMDNDNPVGVIPKTEAPVPAEEMVKSITNIIATGDANSYIQRRRTMPSFLKSAIRAPLPSIPVEQPAPSIAMPPVSQSISCNFQAAMDEKVLVDQIAAIDVTISRELIAAIKGRKSASGKGQVKSGEKLIVHVAPKTNFENHQTSRVEIDPPTMTEPILLSFDVRATNIGSGEIWIIFRQGVAPISILKLYPEVTSIAQDGAKRQSTAQATMFQPDFKNPPNTLIILEQRNGNELRFKYQLHSTALRIMNTYESDAILGDRTAYVENLYKEIENRWTSSGQDVIAFQDELRAYGAELFDSLFPNDLRQILWDKQKQIESILVMSEEPFIPWEMVHLKEPGGALNSDVCFLGQMGLVRWLYGCGYPPSTINVQSDRARYIIPDYPHPDYKLPATQTERDYVERTFHATPITPQPNPVREALIGPASFDLLHFAGHGLAENNNIAHAQLMLEGRVEDGNFIPAYVSATTVQQFANLLGPEAGSNRPLVVINACQAGRAGYTLTRIGGFASAFLDRGAGIFVSSLWSVGDQPACRFVSELYDHLIAGNTLAHSVTAAREAARSAGDATWLAYTVYGNPEARLHYVDTANAGIAKSQPVAAE
jgi:hypothetical protein